MEFTTDWFSARVPEISASVSRLDAPPRRILEIGSWEGRSAVWFLNAFPGCELTCVDTWEGSVEHTPDMVSGVYDRFRRNIQATGFESRVTVLRGSSERVLYGLQPESFDVVYVDGDHHAHAALRDIVFAWGLLRPGGVLLVDDYGGGHPGVDPLEVPTIGVDMFATLWEGKYTYLHRQYQAHFQKNC